MSCVNLLLRFGQRFRVTFDPAYSAKGVPRDKRDPRMMVIRCRTGAEIYPHGGTLLAVEVEGHRNIRKRLDVLPCLKPHQTGTDFASYLFEVRDFPKVAKVVRPYRRRRLTAGQWRDVTAHLASVRPKASAPLPGDLKQRESICSSD
jgi:hypothetical protein